MFNPPDTSTFPTRDPITKCSSSGVIVLRVVVDVSGELVAERRKEGFRRAVLLLGACVRGVTPQELWHTDVATLADA